jgi:hypothetical protein
MASRVLGLVTKYINLAASGHPSQLHGVRLLPSKPNGAMLSQMKGDGA